MTIAVDLGRKVFIVFLHLLWSKLNETLSLHLLNMYIVVFSYKNIYISVILIAVFFSVSFNCKHFIIISNFIQFFFHPYHASARFIDEQWHEISNNMVCATSKGSDQPAHMRSLIRTFASCLNIP